MGTTLHTLAPNEGATQATRSASAVVTARAWTRPPARARRARRPAPVTTASRSRASKAVRRRCRAACRSAASPTARFKKDVFAVNLGDVDARFDVGRRSTSRRSRRRASCPRSAELVKILGDGELSKKLTIVGALLLEDVLKRSSRRPAEARASSSSSPAEGSRSPPHSKESRWPRLSPTSSRSPSSASASLFTLALLAVYRVGIFVTTPGRRPRVMKHVMRGRLGLVPRPVQHVLGRRARAAVDLRARHHAVHLGVDHPAAAHRRRARRSSGCRKKGSRGRRRSTSTPATARSSCRWCRRSSSPATSRASTAPTGSTARSSLNPGLGFELMTMISLTTGTAFIMWLGEQITERGIGNGISLIIFAGIVAGFPDAVVRLVAEVDDRRAT